MNKQSQEQNLKIYNVYFDSEEVIDFVSKSEPKPASDFKVIKIESEAGWAYIHLIVNNKEFQIKYSELMTNPNHFFIFYNQILNLKGSVATFLDYEGSYPLIYVQRFDDTKIRFLFAHDYDWFMNDDIGLEDDIGLDAWKIECDVIIDKKYILNEFYRVLLPYFEKLSKNGGYDDYKINTHYLNKFKESIKSF